MKVNEILWMKRQQMASLYYVCLVLFMSNVSPVTAEISED